MRLFICINNIILQLFHSFMLIYIYEIQTENRGYALPICNAVHMCIFEKENTFFSEIRVKMFYFL